MLLARVAFLSLLAALAWAFEEPMTAELPEEERAEGSCSLELCVPSPGEADCSCSGQPRGHGGEGRG